MLIVPLEQAEPGMTLAAPVPHPEHPDQELLKRGYVIEANVLARMRDLGIPCVYVEYPGLEDLDQHLAGNLSPARQTIYKQIKETINANQKRTRPSVSYTDYYRSTREMVLTLMSQGQHPVYLDLMSRLGGDAVGHAAAVAHLSLLLGIKLERYLIEQRSRLPTHHAKEVVNLGVAGMLHDMGKLKLPADLQEYHSAHLPNEETIEQYESHARLGYELIRDGVEASAAAAVLHHHQHYDGSGFPRLCDGRGNAEAAVAGNSIHVFARIICAADLYDRLSILPNSTQRRPPVEILHLMRTQYAAWLDPTIFGALEAVAPPYPPGSAVELSDGTSAVVIRVPPATPYQPVVRRMKDDRTLEEPPIVLADEENLSIVAACGIKVAPFLPQPLPSSGKGASAAATATAA